MAHTHEIVDTDTSFVIEPLTRAITTESSKLYLTQHDHNSEKYTFKIPRSVEGHDISKCDTIMIDYDNTNRRKTAINSGSYKVTDVNVENEYVLFSWLVSRESTQLAGYLTFSVSFRCYDDEGNIVYEWGTDVFNRITILEKTRHDQTIASNNPDLIGQIKNLLSRKADKTDIETKIDRSEIEEIDAIEIVADMELVSPVAAEDGSVYIDENGALYTL